MRFHRNGENRQNIPWGQTPPSDVKCVQGAPFQPFAIRAARVGRDSPPGQKPRYGIGDNSGYTELISRKSSDAQLLASALYFERVTCQAFNNNDWSTI